MSSRSAAEGAQRGSQPKVGRMCGPLGFSLIESPTMYFGPGDTEVMSLLGSGSGALAKAILEEETFVDSGWSAHAVYRQNADARSATRNCNKRERKTHRIGTISISPWARGLWVRQAVHERLINENLSPLVPSSSAHVRSGS